jgi:hypothetical protein
MPAPLDPFLRAHHVRAGFFSLSDSFSPGSIRDQFVRARLLAESLALEGLVWTGSKILVVGAGVAGTVLASRLATTNPGVSFKIVLVDKGREPLSTLAGCFNRTVSPTLYDWPLLHWQHAQYGSGVFSFTEGSPVEFVPAWRRDFNSIKNLHVGKLDWRPSTKFVDLVTDERPWRVKLSTGSTHYEEEFDLVVNCIGTGRERLLRIREDASRSFPSFKFWEADPFPARGLRGAPIPSDAPPSVSAEYVPVAIIGAGDGGLQELLRFLTDGASLRSVIESIGSACIESKSLFNNLLCLENHFQRRYAWCNGSADQEEVLQDWHDAFSLAVKEFYEQHHEKLADALNNIIKFTEVRLFHPFEHWSRCYALNRFLALLLGEHLKHGGVYIFRSRREATEVSCIDHAPSNQAYQCFGKPHIVYLRADYGREESISCHVLVVRIGSERQGAARLPIQPSAYQLLPCWLPEWGPFTDAIRPSLIQYWQKLLWQYLIAAALVKDKEGKLLYCNPACLSALQMPFDRIVGKTPTQYLEGQIARAMEEHDQEVLKTGRALVSTEKLTTDGKKRITFRFPLIGFGKGSIGALSFEFKRYQYIPHEGPTFPGSNVLGRFFESVPCSIMIRDNTGRVMYANHEYRKVISNNEHSPVTLRSIINKRSSEYLHDHRSLLEEEKARERDVLLERRSSATMDETPFSRPVRFVFRFPLFDSTGLVGIGSIGMDWDRVVRGVRSAENSAGFI